MVNDKINVVGTNIAEKAIMIWNVADMLRDPFKPHEYGLVILPMIHFNPRSPCGERRFKCRQDKYGKYFNPRSPCGERLPRSFRIAVPFQFQSTLPVWGATSTSFHVIVYNQLFQSTLPVWGATSFSISLG